MRLPTLLSVLVSSVLVAKALPAEQAVFPSVEDASLLSELSMFEGRVEGYSLDLNALRLVRFGVDEEPIWMTEREKIIAKSRGHLFMDITETPDLASFASTNLAHSYKFASPISSHVGPILSLLSEDEPRANLAHFSSYRTRYSHSDTGRESSEWLLTKVREYTAAAPEHVRAQTSVEPFNHTGYDQISIIARFNPVSLDARSSPVTIVGAHNDCVNRNPFLPSPGADDDGSGTISILEAHRVLLESEYIPTTPVEFHWYAAEETGLLGSQDIVQSYAEAGTLVKGQQQFDMTAWIHKDFEEVVGICTNGVDSDLTEFNRGLVERYLSIPWRNTICPYGCSDHQSWEHAGYKASASFEDLFEHMKPTAGRHVHDIYDTTDHPEFSFAHVLEFSKLAVAFVVELGGFEGKE